MCGAAIQVIEQMDPQYFEECCATIGHDVDALRATATTLNPLVDVEAERQTRRNLLTKTRDQANLNLFVPQPSCAGLLMLIWVGTLLQWDTS